MGNLNNKRRKFKNLRVLSIQVSIVHTSKTFRVPPHLYMVHRSFSTHVRLLGLFQTRIGLFRSLAQIVLAPIAFTEFRISTAPGSFPKSPTQATQTEHRGPPTNQTAHKHVTKVIGTSHAVTRGIYLFTLCLEGSANRLCAAKQLQQSRQGRGSSSFACSDQSFFNRGRKG